jgi:hypothetical protein
MSARPSAPPKPPPLVTFSGAGRTLGIGRQTVADLVARLGIVPKPVPWNANGKGLDPADMSRLRRALERIARSA